MLRVQSISPVAGFDSSFAHISQSTMPVDFASYLLSASPPGFELHYALRDQFGFNPRGFTGRREKVRNTQTPLKPIIVHNKLHKNDDDIDDDDDADDDDSAPSSPTSVTESECSWMPSDCLELEENINSSNNKSKSQLVTPASKSGMKKKVSFADESGLALVAVRILTEASNSPPRLRPELLANLSLGASAAATETPPLVFNFTQPASDYLTFRERINKNCVCLENVILKDYNLVGTVKVKNIAFKKSVTLRVTFDSWDTFIEIPASYMPNCAVGGPFDTFSFTISVPSNMDVRKKMQFAVLYVVDQQQFWDNNNGANYEVVSADWRSSKSDQPSSNTTDGVVFGLYGDEKWTEFSGWQNMDSSVPYY